MAVQYLIEDVNLENTPFEDVTAKASNVSPMCLIYEMAKNGYMLDARESIQSSETYYFEKHVVDGRNVWEINRGICDKDFSVVGNMHYVVYDEALAREMQSYLVALESEHERESLQEFIEAHRPDILNDRDEAIQKSKEYKASLDEYLKANAPKEMTYQQAFFQKMADQLQSWSEKFRKAMTEPIQGRTLLKKFVSQVATWGKETVKYLTGQKDLFATIDNKLDEIADKFVEGATQLRQTWKDYVNLKTYMADVPIKPSAYGVNKQGEPYAEVMSIYANMGYIKKNGALDMWNESAEKMYIDFASRVLEKDDIKQIYKKDNSTSFIDFRAYEDRVEAVLTFNGKEYDIPLKDHELKHLKSVVTNKLEHGERGYKDRIYQAKLNYLVNGKNREYILYNGKVTLGEPQHYVEKSRIPFSNNYYNFVEIDTSFTENTNDMYLNRVRDQLYENGLDTALKYFDKAQYGLVTQIGEDGAFALYAVHRNNPDHRYEVELTRDERAALRAEVERASAYEFNMSLTDVVNNYDYSVQNYEDSQIRRVSGSQVQINYLTDNQQGSMEVEFTNVSETLADKLSMKATEPYPRKDERFVAKFDDNGHLSLFVRSDNIQGDIPLSLSPKEQQLFTNLINKEYEKQHNRPFNEFLNEVRDAPFAAQRVAERQAKMHERVAENYDKFHKNNHEKNGQNYLAVEY